MINNKLILRSVESPYGDVTRGSVLSHDDVDNNFLYLKSQVYVTGGTAGQNLILTNRNGESLIIDLTGLANAFDVFVTGGTYSSGTATFTNNTGGTFTVSGFTTGGTGSNLIITGGTYINSLGRLTLTNNTGGTVTVTGFTTGVTSFDASVDFTGTDPNISGTTFTPNTPNLTTVVYISDTNGGQWTYNGSVYLPDNTPYWSKFGNTATTTNFIGTTNNVPINFRTNNIRSGGIDQLLNNVSFGQGALLNNTGATAVVAIGHNALRTTTNSANNTAIGYYAMFATTGATAINNTAIGNQVMYTNSSGRRNVAVGHHAMINNTTGSHNVILSAYDVSGDPLNSTGSFNVHIGYNSAKFQNGDMNIAIGSATLGGFSGGPYASTQNTCVGHESMFTVQGGSLNTSLGYRAGYATTTGSNNICIGSEAGYNNVTGSSQIFINSLSRGSLIGDVTLSPIYIQQNAAITGQTIYLNGDIILPYTSGTTTGQDKLMGVIDFTGKLGRVIVGSGLTLTAGTISTTPSSTLGYQKVTLGVAGNYNITDNDYTISVDHGSNNVTIVLPSPTTRLGRIYIIKYYDGIASGTVTVSSVSGNVQDKGTFAYGSTYVLANRCYIVQSNGTDWECIAS